MLYLHFRRALPAMWVAALVSAVLAPASAAPADPLEQGFIHPPDSARPHTWWHWMDGNISRKGITLDLEAMKRVGVGGAQIFTVAVGIPPGPVKFLSPEWLAMVKHAAREADRLGLELCIHNCAGWSSSGGPWNTPGHAMQMVTTSELQVKGPLSFAAALPQPETRCGYYRDIAVLAFPTPPGGSVLMADRAPRLSASTTTFEGAKIVDGSRATQAYLPLPAAGAPQYVQFEFPEAFPARSLAIAAPPNNGHRGELQVSDDGKSFRPVARFAIPGLEVGMVEYSLNFEPVSARFYRLLFTGADMRARRVGLAEVALRSDCRLENYATKADYQRGDALFPSILPPPQPGQGIARESILDLSSKLNAEGRLTWEVPAGNWTLLRVGYTPTGKQNAPAPPEGAGLECDKLSREAADAHWQGMMARVIAELGPLAGRSLKHVLIDSYEVASQNWTPRLREEFRKRRGYDPLPYLPAMTGRVVGSTAETERFLWDLRRTIADLFTENYCGRMAELCHRQGLQLSVEPYGNGPLDNLSYGGPADIPMSEFWAGSGGDNQCSKLASSVAHIYGRKYVGAEAFTAEPADDAWRNHPYTTKAKGDLVYTGGVNRFIFHRYAHQPWTDRFPGMTMGRWGMHFERTNTWWERSTPWLTYVTRCQYLLQEGRFAADLCYFAGEDAPSSLPSRSRLQPPPPPGYDYDGCNADVILNRMGVKDGRIVLPDGMSYSVLVLPPSRAMTPALLRKLRNLVRAGAAVIGPRPEYSPSLQGYPECDREVRSLAAELWGDCNGTTITEHAYGQGRVYWGKPLADVLAARHLGPDFAVAGEANQARVVSIHRRIGSAEVYFVSNQRPRSEAVECSFRVRGYQPELWHADTGVVEPAPVWREQNGRTHVWLCFEPAGSVFVVFRRPAGGADPFVSVQRDGQSIFVRPKRPGGKLEIIQATYGATAAQAPQTDQADVTQLLVGLIRDGVLNLRVDNTTLGGDPVPNMPKQLRVEYTLDGKPQSVTVNENQTLRIPATGQAQGTLVIRRALYGLLATRQERPAVRKGSVDVTAQLAARVRDGALTCEVGNTLAGDPAPNEMKRLTVEYKLDGQTFRRVLPEHTVLEIPDGDEQVAGGPAFPTARVAVAADGTPVLAALEPGRYELTKASGKRVVVDVPAVPPTIAVAGPWEVQFPPNWGAPEHVTFAHLLSWPQHPDPGVRYFSGTATYRKEVDVPADLLGSERALWLDLGSVQVIARVKCNGKDLGILWKPPFRVPITGVARPGKNQLEVQVTNLWPNRLIGDEQLPDDRTWVSGKSLRAWPAWMLEGKPMPRTGRYTWATWRHYTKESSLLDSGLIGPVMLCPALYRPATATR